MRKERLAEEKSLFSGHLARDLNPGRLTPKSSQTSLILGGRPGCVGAVKSPSGRLKGAGGQGCLRWQWEMERGGIWSDWRGLECQSQAFGPLIEQLPVLEPRDCFSTELFNLYSHLGG